MEFLLVDDEPLALKNLELEILNLYPNAQINSFTSPDKALSWVRENQGDIALLDINMRTVDGLTLAKLVREYCPQCAIIFVTGYAQYAVEAFKLHASGYLMKPIDPEALRQEIEYAFHRPGHQPQRVRVQCFGNFEVFLDGKILNFPRKRSKELLAYLIDRRGAGATMAEIASILWEDGKYDKSRNRQIHVFLHDLTQVFSEAKLENLLLRQHNTVAVDCSQIQCDYYDFLDGQEKAVSSYFGEYMTQYSWAETTNGSLQSFKDPMETR